MKNINKKKILICIFFSLFLISEKLVAEENWKIDKNLSEIEMKLQIFPGDDILIDFRKFDGLFKRTLKYNHYGDLKSQNHMEIIDNLFSRLCLLITNSSILLRIFLMSLLYSVTDDIYLDKLLFLR